MAAAVVVFACAMGAAVLSLGSANPERGAIILVGGLGWVILGAYQRTRTEDPIGAFAVIVGLVWLLGRLDEADGRLAFTVGQVIGLLDIPVTVLVLITFPTGRLSRSPAAVDPVTGRVDPRRVRSMRRFVLALVVWALPMNLWVLFTDEPSSLCDCAGRNLMVADVPEVALTLQALQAVSLLVLGVLFVRWFERAFRRRGPMHRSAQLPVRLAVLALLAVFCLYMVAGALGVSPLESAASLVQKVAFMVVPVLYGFGLFRWAELEDAAAATLERSGARGPRQVQDTLRTALMDADLRIEFPPDGPPAADDLTRTAVTGPDGALLAVAHHGLRQPDSTLLDRALAWAARRLAPADATDHPEEAARWAGLVAGLTDAELATAELLSRRWTNQQIAGRFHLALGTVHNRVTRIYQKLELDQLTRRERAALIARLGHVITAEQRRRGVDPADPPPGPDTP